MQKKSYNLVSNPFSDAFLEVWQLWKDYRKQEHNFQYKGVISEQMALKRLVEVSEGDEQKAQRIVEQSISRGWMDFYQLKQPSNNGKSSNKAAKPTVNSIQSDVSTAFKNRYGGGETPGNSEYLKAV